MDNLPDKETDSDWLTSFEATVPAERHQLLLNVLNLPPSLTVSEADLTSAAVNHSQQLAEHNQLEAIQELMQALGERPAAKVLEPAWRLLQIQQALFEKELNQLNPLLNNLEAFATDIPPDQWADLLDELAYYSQAEAASRLAQALQDSLGEDALAKTENLAFAVERHQVMPAVETYWRSAATAEDKQVFQQAMLAADFESIDLPALTELSELSAQAQLSKLKQAFRDRDLDAALLPAQMAFGRWLLEKHSLNLATASQMIEQAFALWELAPADKRPEFSKWAQIKPADFLDYCEHLSHENGPDAFVLLWGLPFVNAWLLETGLSNLFVSHHLLSLLKSAREQLFKERGPAVWTGGFVINWPLPEPSPDIDIQAVQAYFKQAKQQRLPLSETTVSETTENSDHHPH